tara:strand:+ start:532 stop:753 length:222 start_codon:yes stop_codon:yes gene_type:complete
MEMDNENKNNGIFKPTTIVNYIARDETDTIRDYGSVGIGLVWTTKWAKFEIYHDKEEYVNVLLDSGITLEGEI